MATPDWASLPSDLLLRVADVFVATSDLDYYMSLRAVCQKWRAATDDPRGPDPDPRFSPRGWVMVSSLAGDDNSRRRCLLLHVDTGRLLWKELPMICKHACVTGGKASTEDGHLVLEPVLTNSGICLLNPITGHHVPFPPTTAQFHGSKKFGLPIGRPRFDEDSLPMVLYSHFDSVSGGCIDPSCFNRESLFEAKPHLGRYIAMVPFKGRAYAVYNSGSVAVVEHNCRLDEKPVFTTVVANEWNRVAHRGLFVVHNAGELLLVRHLISGQLLVFRVDFENRVLQQIESVGNRAIFLGDRRCISVDASNLPGVECNSLYYIGNNFCRLICVQSLNDGSRIDLSDDIVQEGLIRNGPMSLAIVLMEYAGCSIMPIIRFAA